jgi:Phosphopantetheine attachment site
LRAIRVLGKISKGFGVRLPLRALFDAPTIEQLAVLVDKERTPAAQVPPPGGGITSRSRDAHRSVIPTTPSSDS